MSDWVVFAFVVGADVLVIMLVTDLLRYLRWRRDNRLLEPGQCECTHPRCTHADGKGRCAVHGGGVGCACLLYVPIAGENLIHKQELKQLRKMAGLDK